jgi:putative tryptophan/tyrosine transport system substrate-binding protein
MAGLEGWTAVASVRTGLPRRDLLRGSLALAGLGLLSGCGMLPSPGEPRAIARTIGFLATGPREGRAHLIAAFLEGLRERDFVEGRHFAMVYRFAARGDEFPRLAADLVELKVDVILASGTPASIAAKHSTTTIPIVMGGSGDPVATGLVASHARPGGNVTGMSLLSPQVMGKRLELLKEVVPGLARVAVISNVTNPLHVPQDQEIEAAGRALAIQIGILPVRSAADFEGAFRDAAAARADAVYPATDSIVTNAGEQLAELALRYRLPSVFDYRENVAPGGLLAYGPSLTALYRRAAGFVDRIFKGASPADLPMEQPTAFDLYINLKTAQALGLTIPRSVIAQATELIQ